MAKKKIDTQITELLKGLEKEFSNFKSANSKDFRECTCFLFQTCFETILNMMSKSQDDFDIVSNTLQKRFKIMDKAITDLFKFRNNFEDLRFFLLLQAAKVEAVVNRLTENNIIPKDINFYNEMWNDNLVSLLGYDCTANELRQKIGIILK